MSKLISLALVDDDPAVRDLWTRQLNRTEGFRITGDFADAGSAVLVVLTTNHDLEAFHPGTPSGARRRGGSKLPAGEA